MRVGKFYPLWKNPLFSPSAAINQEAPRACRIFPDISWAMTSLFSNYVESTSTQVLAGRDGLRYSGTHIAAGSSFNWTLDQIVQDDPTTAVIWRFRIEDLFGDAAGVEIPRPTIGWGWTFGGGILFPIRNLFADPPFTYTGNLRLAPKPF